MEIETNKKKLYTVMLTRLSNDKLLDLWRDESFDSEVEEMLKERDVIRESKVSAFPGLLNNADSHPRRKSNSTEVFGLP